MRHASQTGFLQHGSGFRGFSSRQTRQESTRRVPKSPEISPEKDSGRRYRSTSTLPEGVPFPPAPIALGWEGGGGGGETAGGGSSCRPSSPGVGGRGGEGRGGGPSRDCSLSARETGLKGSRQLLLLGASERGPSSKGAPPPSPASWPGGSAGGGPASSSCCGLGVLPLTVGSGGWVSVPGRRGSGAAPSGSGGELAVLRRSPMPAAPAATLAETASHPVPKPGLAFAPKPRLLREATVGTPWAKGSQEEQQPLRSSPRRGPDAPTRHRLLLLGSPSSKRSSSAPAPRAHDTPPRITYLPLLRDCNQLADAPTISLPSLYSLSLTFPNPVVVMPPFSYLDGV